MDKAFTCFIISLLPIISLFENDATGSKRKNLDCGEVWLSGQVDEVLDILLMIPCVAPVRGDIVQPVGKRSRMERWCIWSRHLLEIAIHQFNQSMLDDLY